jgi:hypothetical protein
MVRFLLCFVNWKGKLILKPLPTSVDTWGCNLEDKIIAGDPYRLGNQHYQLHEERLGDSKLKARQGLLKVKLSRNSRNPNRAEILPTQHIKGALE